MIRITYGRIVSSEWTKLRTLRSTWVMLAGAAVFVVATAGGIGWNVNRGRAEPPTVAQAVGGAFLGVDLFSVVVGVLGVLMITSEYGSGLIRATLAAVPRRLPVLPAKAAVLVAVVFPVMVAVCVASFLVSQAFVAAGDRVTLGDPHVLRAVAGAAAAPVAFALLGLGLGALLRHTAGAITVFVAAVLVVPALLPAVLSTSLQETLLPYVPTAAVVAMYEVSGESGGLPVELLSPGMAALVTTGWVALLLAAGTAVLRYRDA